MKPCTTPVRAAVLGVILLLIGGPAAAARYMTSEQVRSILFPGATDFVEVKAPWVEGAQVWDVHAGAQRRGWLVVDAVIGKHEPIDYALALDATGAVVGLEILEYRESYGYEVRNAAWRGQFVGMDSARLPELGVNVDAISGATLSSRHLTEAVRAWLQRIGALQ